MFEVEALIVAFLFLAENAVVEGLISQEAQLEDKLDALFEVSSCRLDIFVTL